MKRGKEKGCFVVQNSINIAASSDCDSGKVTYSPAFKSIGSKMVDLAAGGLSGRDCVACKVQYLSLIT